VFKFAMAATVSFFLVPSPAQSNDDSNKAARQALVDRMNETIQQNGANTHVSDHDGQLTLTNKIFDTKSARADVMRELFPPSVRRDLCKIGFKSISFRTGFIAYSETVYSAGCPETKEEAAARAKLDTKAMAEYVASLQEDLSSAAPGVHMSVSGSTLVITGGGNSQLGRMLASSPDVKGHLCSIGFRGTRTGGVYASLGCR
jgi:hypothetical protein